VFPEPVPRMMLLIGMKINLTKYPINPITKNPITQAWRIFMYSKWVKKKTLTFSVWLLAFVQESH